jgi:hypothetical protein
MSTPSIVRWTAAGLCLAAALVLPATVRGAATINILVADGPNEGFNDPSPTTPVGGNSGTTLGQQRLNVFVRAAQIWEADLNSAVPIQVQASFDPLFCSAQGALLGQAGPVNVFRDFAGAPVPNTFYVSALANALAGSDLDPANPDIAAQFNSNLGTPACTSFQWYYGLDNNPPGGQIDLLAVVLHELAHGLGFLTLVDLQTGAKFQGRDDAYMRHLERHATGQIFPAMSDSERLAAMTSVTDLHWVGANVVNASGLLTAGRHATGHVEMYAPNPVQPGSSVSHFSTSLVPNELMEPFATASPIRTLTVELFRDIGWPLATGGGNPALSINDITVIEGNSGTANANFVVTLSPAASSTVTVNFTTADGTATVAGNDYVGVSGTLTFNPGQTILSIPVAIVGDTTVEGDEQFTVTLTNPNGATITKAQGICTIQDDDGGSFKDLLVTVETNANTLVTALTGTSTNSGLIVKSATLLTHVNTNGASSGLYTLVGPAPHTYNLNLPGIVLSCGNVLDYEAGTNSSTFTSTRYGVPATAAQEALLDTITGGTFNHNDVTELTIVFDASPFATEVTFLAVFGSEEFPEFVGSFVDGFGIFLNGTNIAFTAGQPINIDHPDMKVFPGTELDGVIAPSDNPILQFAASIQPGSTNNRLTFIIADTLDDALDTTVYISALQATLIEPVSTIPVVTSFTPASGPVGATVTITGENFHPTISSNHVYFGTVRAKVLTATTTQLTVVAPPGTVHAPIVVEIGGRAGTSRLPFVTTFPTDGQLNAKSFGNRADFAAGIDPRATVLADFNGDGKLDLVAANAGGGNISVFRNVTSTGSISPGSLATKIDLSTATGPISMAVGDVDGDGRLDLVVAAYSARRLSLFRNIGTGTAINFTPPTELVTGNNPRGVAIRDLDGDGRFDLVVANEGDASVSLFRNVGLIGDLSAASFEARVDFVVGSKPSAVATGDLDGDGRPDIVVLNSFNGIGGNSISVLRNTAAPGPFNGFSLAPRVNLGTGAGPNGLALADLDLDGRPDIVTANGGNSTVSVFRNAAVSGVLDLSSFAARVDFASGGGTRSLAVADFDGDSRPDIAVINEFISALGILRNVSVSGTISASSFAPRVTVFTASNPFGLAAGDMDVEGRPDLVVANTSGTVSILRNLLKADPGIVWTTPGDINYGTPLNGVQLNATSSANALGAFVYTPQPGTVLPAGSHSLQVVFVPFDQTRFNFATNTVPLFVGKTNLTVTVNNTSRAYGDPNPVFSGTITGIQNNDNITAVYTTTATPASGFGPHPIQVTLVDPGNRLPNYDVSTPDGTLTVTRAPLTVNVADATRGYGDPNPSFSGGLVGLKNNDVISVAYTSALGPATAVGTHVDAITAQLPASGAIDNYNPVTVNAGDLTITNATLTVTASNVSRPFGQENPSFTASFVTLKNGDNITANFDTAAGPSSPVGDYDLSITSLNDPDDKLGNYTVATVNGTLTVTRADPPVVTLPGGPLAYTENDSATIIDAGATVTDGGSEDFDGGSLTANLGANAEADDRLAVRHVGLEPGEVGVLPGGVVTFGGTIIGAVSGGNGTTPLVVNFGGTAATPAAAQAVLRNLTYHSVSELPSEAPRTLSVVVTDGDGGTSAAAMKTIQVDEINDPPTVVFLSPAYNAAFKALASFTVEVQVGDVDGSVTSVELTLNEGTPVVLTGPPYKLDVVDAGVGNYTFTASVTDDRTTTTDLDVTVSIHPAINSGRVNQDGEFELTITGEPGQIYDIEVSPDLVNWTFLGQVVVGTGATPFVDQSQASAIGQRFYRFRLSTEPD